MRYFTFTAAAAAALLSTVSADINVAAFDGNATCVQDQPKARVFNRCPYPVYLWSVIKGQGCPSSGAVVVEPGDFYQENLRQPDKDCGVSIKIAKEEKCTRSNLVQLEYFLDNSTDYANNYLDVSYVDCRGDDCPTKQEGFFMKAGKEVKVPLRECPELSCNGPASCAKMAYINPHDEQTKSCGLEEDLDFYMCGGEAPGEDSGNYDEPTYEAPSSSAEETQPESTSSEEEETPVATFKAPANTPEAPAYTPEAPSSTEEAQAYAAQVTPAPVVEEGKTKYVTEVVYATQYEYVNAKRHAHGHRHQHFRA